MGTTGQLTFENTEVAFASLSDAELTRAAWLFTLISNSKLVSIGSLGLKAGMSLNLPVEWIVKKTVFEHFCGGETIEECAETVRRLHLDGIGSILDYSVEGGELESGFEDVTREIIGTIEFAARNNGVPYAVFKMTGIAPNDVLENPKPSAEWDKVRARVLRICEAAAKHKVKLLIDAEETWFQDTIDLFAEEMMEKFNKEQAIIFNTLQMYRTDRLKALRKMEERAKKGGYWLGVKIVRGAYLEKERDHAKAKGFPSPLHATKAETDQAYDDAVEFSVANIDHVAICAGTHNESSSLLLTKLMRDKNIAKNDNRIYFAQLLGMSDHISYNLVAHGYNVAKYVPYGPVRTMMPYLMRRAQENTAIAGQTSRELRLINAELKRRRLSK